MKKLFWCKILLIAGVFILTLFACDSNSQKIIILNDNTNPMGYIFMP